jgi:hypothetical protein
MNRVPPGRRPVNETPIPPLFEHEVLDNRYHIRSSADDGNEKQVYHRRFRLLEVSRMLRISRIQKGEPILCDSSKKA